LLRLVPWSCATVAKAGGNATIARICAQALEFIRRQRQKGELLLSERLDANALATWKNTTREVLVRALGSDSENTRRFGTGVAGRV
jgi:hypothetical protein